MDQPSSTTGPPPSEPSKQREQEYLDRDRRLRENNRRRKFVDMVGGAEKFEHFTFEKFDRRRAPAPYDAAVRFDKGEHNLFFWGPSGVGKTHLAMAIARRAFNQGEFVQVIAMPDFKDRLRLYESEHRYAEKIKLITELVDADVLVVHELGRGKIPASEMVQETLWTILERRRRRGGMIMTSNFDPPYIGRMYGGTISERIKDMCGESGIILFPPKPTGGHS